MSSRENIVYERGETVEVFYRFALDKGPGYFPVENYWEGMSHPLIVKTDGWFKAIIEEKWTSTTSDLKQISDAEARERTESLISNSNAQSSETDALNKESDQNAQGRDVIASRDGGFNRDKGSKKKGKGKNGDQDSEKDRRPKDGKYKDYLQNPVKIKFLCPLWFNRLGEQFTETRYRKQQVSFRLVRKLPKEGDPEPTPPKVSLFVVRWGGKRKVNAVQEGLGGWGNVGSNPSDPFINTVLGQIPMEVLNGPNYEVITAFIQSTHELRDDREGINASLVRAAMDERSCNKCGLFFLWPIAFQDGHEFCGYVNKVDLLHCMARLEGAGIVSRFPHHSPLYSLLASKDWTCSWGLIDDYKCPLTTKISRASIMEMGWDKAAMTAIVALNDLNCGRKIFRRASGSDLPTADTISKGVAKLGFSWEAMDVRHWDSPQSLAENLEQLVIQIGNKCEYVHVQEFIKIDVEMRCFIVLSKHSTEKQLPIIEKIVYTCYESQEENAFSDFNRFDRKTCLEKRFKGDEKALNMAESLAQKLIGKLLVALRGECSEMPPVLRFDVLARRVGPGKAEVNIGEITELGACFLGWSEGPEVCFKALIKSCLGSDRKGTWNDKDVEGTWPAPDMDYGAPAPYNYDNDPNANQQCHDEGIDYNNPHNEYECESESPDAQIYRNVMNEINCQEEYNQYLSSEHYPDPKQDAPDSDYQMGDTSMSLTQDVSFRYYCVFWCH